ncbi:MAG: hypothetical protein U9O49_02350 [Candidatus Thermoplasmatota archaeon]|nr:hypothetical protein [Candidatus Thermoplasmatota archaeon]
MTEVEGLNSKIKALKGARDVLQEQYENTEFHRRKEANPQDTAPPSPEDEEIFKLLTAIQQLNLYIKKLQDEQFEVLKEQDDN